jgi:hypothetical protein
MEPAIFKVLQKYANMPVVQKWRSYFSIDTAHSDP